MTTIERPSRRVTSTWQEVLGVLGTSLLGSLMFLAIGQAVVGLFRSAPAVSAVTRVLFIAFILVGLLGATGAFGGTVKTFSSWTPVGAVVELFGVVFGSPWTGDTMAGVVAVPVYAIVFAVIGVRFLRWESR